MLHVEIGKEINKFKDILWFTKQDYKISWNFQVHKYMLLSGMGHSHKKV